MKYIITGICFLSIIPFTIIQAFTGPNAPYLYKTVLNTETDCKISPNIKILLAIPQDKDFEKKYITEYESVLREQCHEWVVMDVFLQNDTGVFRTKTHLRSTFPACLQLPLLIWSSWLDEEIPRDLLVSGTFLERPLVLNKNLDVIKGNFALTDDYILPGQEGYAESYIPPTPKIRNSVVIPASLQKIRTKFENVSHLPECKPNIRPKK